MVVKGQKKRKAKYISEISGMNYENESSITDRKSNKQTRFWLRRAEFQFEHVNFEISIRYPGRDPKQISGEQEKYLVKDSLESYQHTDGT